MEIMSAKEAYKKTKEVYQHREWKSERYDPIIAEFIQSKIDAAIEKGDYECDIFTSHVIPYSYEKLKSSEYASTRKFTLKDISYEDMNIILKSLDRVIEVLNKNEYAVSSEGEGSYEFKDNRYKLQRYRISWG